MRPFISVIVPIAPRFSSVPVRYENLSVFFFVSPKIDRKSLKNRQFSFCTFSPLSVFSTFPSPYLPFFRIKKGLKALSYLKSLFLSIFTCEFLGDFSPILVGRRSGSLRLLSCLITLKNLIALTHFQLSITICIYLKDSYIHHIGIPLRGTTTPSPSSKKHQRQEWHSVVPSSFA